MPDQTAKVPWAQIESTQVASNSPPQFREAVLNIKHVPLSSSISERLYWSNNIHSCSRESSHYVTRLRTIEKGYYNLSLFRGGGETHITSFVLKRAWAQLVCGYSCVDNIYYN